MSAHPVYTRLRTADRDRAAAALITIANELQANHARHVQQAMATAAENGYPARGSTAPTQHTNQTDEHGHHIAALTATEAAALRPDPAAVTARHHIGTLDRLLALAGPALDALLAYRPDRPVAVCQRCGKPLDRAQGGRCYSVDDEGRPCHGSDRPEQCSNCGDELVVGQIRAGRCPKCARHWSRHKRERITTGALQIDLQRVEVTD